MDAGDCAGPRGSTDARLAPPLTICLECAGGTDPHLVLTGMERSWTECPQEVTGRHHATARVERLGHAGRSRRHPPVDQRHQGVGGDPVGRGPGERGDDITASHPTVRSERDGRGEPVLVDQPRHRS